MNEIFEYCRPVAYYETDAMGVVHHANYLKILEDARIAWLRERKAIKTHQPYTEIVFAVVDANVKFIKPLFFNDNVLVKLQVRQERARFRFQYGIFRQSDGVHIATGMTLHVAVDKTFSVVKPPQQLTEIIREEAWNEIWP